MLPIVAAPQYRGEAEALGPIGADVGRPILAAAAFLGGSGRLKASLRAKLPAPQGPSYLSLYYASLNSSEAGISPNSAAHHC
jgi:hypothetical protein